MFAVTVLAGALLTGGVASSAPAAPVHCRLTASLAVPGAGQQDPTAWVSDLTTPGLVATGNTDQGDKATLTSAKTAAQPGTPGMQTDLFTFLPTALQHHPAAENSTAGHDALAAAGFAPGSEPLWNHHYAIYWDLSQHAYREESDPGCDGAERPARRTARSGPGATCSTTTRRGRSR